MNLPPILMLLALTMGLVAAGKGLAQEAEPQGRPSHAQPETQPETRPNAQASAQPSIFVGQLGDADTARLTSMLEGSWKTTEPLGGNDTPTWMHMLPFETDLLGRAIYVEIHQDGTPWEPTRQAIFRVYRYGDRLRLRTYEFREADRPKVLANLWLAPQAMPLETIRPDDLIAIMDVELQRGKNGYVGRTPHAYPTRDGRSVEMTTSLSVRPDRLVSHDTFYGVDGSPLETPAGGEVTWERAQLPATVQTDDDGLVIITLEEGLKDGPTTNEGDVVFLNYKGWRTNGQVFDSSWDRGLAMRTVYPLRVVTGFRRGLEPLVEGVRRKLVVPPELGFGQAVMQNLPAGSTLIFHIHVVRVEQADPISPEDRKKRAEQP